MDGWTREYSNMGLGGDYGYNDSVAPLPLPKPATRLESILERGGRICSGILEGLAFVGMCEVFTLPIAYVGARISEVNNPHLDPSTNAKHWIIGTALVPVVAAGALGALYVMGEAQDWYQRHK